MASFHFRIKTDKKPNGTKVKAIEHLQYINRDGKYQDVEQRRSYQKERNIIAGSNTKDALNGQYGILYNSPYGKITNTNDGLLITDKPSDETLAIVLMIAKESMRNEKLIINGTPAFKTQLLSVAANMDLPPDIFADKALCDLYQKFIKEQKENAREIRNGRSSELGKSRRTNFRIGTSIRRESIFDDDSIESNAQSNCRKTLRIITRQGLCLPTLSSRNLVSNARQSSKSKLLLPSIPFSDLVDWRSDEGHFMRRKKYGIKHYAELSAKKILKNIEQHMDVVFAASHAAYINRESAFTQRGGCIYKNHQLPTWAKDDPKKFFAAADRYELKSNYRYKEIEAALPNELNLDQQRELIEQFLGRHLKDFYYAYAIHDKIGAMSNGEHNTHVHIMFSERKIDEVERKCPRAASRFFLYPKRGAKTFEDKRKGGSPKDRKWSTGTYILQKCEKTSQKYKMLS